MHNICKYKLLIIQLVNPRTKDNKHLWNGVIRLPTQFDNQRQSNFFGNNHDETVDDYYLWLINDTQINRLEGLSFKNVF